MRADRPGMDEALRLIDRRTVSQRYPIVRTALTTKKLRR
jgi:hypothetical protein